MTPQPSRRPCAVLAKHRHDNDRPASLPKPASSPTNSPANTLATRADRRHPPDELGYSGRWVIDMVNKILTGRVPPEWEPHE